MNTTKLDGLCSWSPVDDRPHVLLATDKMSFPRRQMDAAHELAHVVLHKNVPETEFEENLRIIEKQAFRLADIEALCGLRQGWCEMETAKLVTLETDSDHSSRTSNGKVVLFPFEKR
ncbi:ImmA/IrrE family metallo-endopeptidase [Agrobacterium larrymoorei]|uniref:ImmA/IrrE family metallo-endopeptidase n=1 Tax=Agrobacterium larrymoorei TaxID=160699 RepID=A0AAF0KG13_9HYPH|nr:ImmA/IrrE family metallo-endopeptidase [Agrobacterium larrymoorei]WHA44065.1 ImmA/IrrE family metallo-endopeptidase [Agrobacterium larrymoorei]